MTLTRQSPPAYVPVEPLLVIFHIPRQVQLHLRLGFLILSLHTQTTALYSSQDTQPCFHLLYLSPFSLSLSCRSLHSHGSRLPPLLDSFCWGIESHCALRRVSLKSCQLCSAPMPLWTVSQGIPLSSSLSSWKFALLKHKVLALLFARPTFFKITNSTTAWSLQPNLPPVLTSLMLSSALESTRSSKASPQIGPSITWTKKLSATFPATATVVVFRHILL